MGAALIGGVYTPVGGEERTLLVGFPPCPPPISTFFASLLDGKFGSTIEGEHPLDPRKPGPFTHIVGDLICASIKRSWRSWG